MAGFLEPSAKPYIERQTLCIAGSIPGLATHAGEQDFSRKLRKYYKPDENNVAERLVHFKAELELLEGEAFWSRLMSGMTDICQSQFAFVSKRILVDDHTTAVEMPKIGEKGSCLMAVALYFNDGKGQEKLFSDYKYYAWSAPCAYMKHDKVFLIPENLNDFITDNPNGPIPLSPDSYLGIPLFAEGKCYAHFGQMWTKEGLQLKKDLSWTFMEMFMHSLEDLISKRLLAGQGFSKAAESKPTETTRFIPQAAITATQSLKLYARSLSHELRTPMQGVVGMLDLMYSTVQEQIEGQNNNQVRKIFQSLKDSIETVQDSSKRAVEAADNVVQAYDLNMQVPDTPSHDNDSPAGAPRGYFEGRPSMMEGSQIVNPNKRRRATESTDSMIHPTKLRVTRSAIQDDVPSPSPRSMGIDATARDTETSAKIITPPTPKDGDRWRPPSHIELPSPTNTLLEGDTSVSTPSLRQSNIRDVLPTVIHDSLRLGGRPDYAVSEPTPLGERTEVRTRSSNGYSSQKVIEWTADPDVPYMIPIDERDLSKLVGAVFLNAIKFTENGDINIRVCLSSSKRNLLILITDTGTGIPDNFLPELFKAFSKEENTITRTKEGLGLGLLVAKGLARRVGGDIRLVRSAIDGPEQGSQFEIRLPLDPGDTTSSRATTPFRQTAETDPPRSAPPTASVADTLSMDQSPSLRDISPSKMRSPEPPPPQIQVPSSEPPKKRKKPSPPPLIDLNRRGSTALATPAPVGTKPDRELAKKYPLSFLVAEDNKINRKLLVQMLAQLGYQNVHEAYDGKEAVRVVEQLVQTRGDHEINGKRRHSTVEEGIRNVVDVILMDLWMPEMDGYQATEEILHMFQPGGQDKNGGERTTSLGPPPTVLAVSADVTDAAIDRATKVGMAGYMSKPYKTMDLQKLILEFCVTRGGPVSVGGD